MKTFIGSFDSDRGRKFCRACGGKELLPILDFGNLPIANELPLDGDSVVELFPLNFSICKICGLGQVGEPVSRERLFRDYRYLSSISDTWLMHARTFTQHTIETLNLTPGDLVVEVASNDGYLLQYFKEFGIGTLGVEPAENIAKKAEQNGIRTIIEFFGVDVAEKIKQNYQIPRLIVANNVAAHVPDLQDFFGGMSILAGEKTIISIENPSILNLLKYHQFDTIYHEHYSYLSAYTIQKMGIRFGLNLFKVESLNTHGGSNRYWLRQANPSIEERIQVEAFIKEEIDYGLVSHEVWLNFSKDVSKTLKELVDWVSACKLQERRVFGFTAAAKASTILNAAKIEASDLAGIADSSPEKQGRFLSSMGIPIISMDVLRSKKPTDILIFSWNISDEISNIIWGTLGEDIRCWIAIPELMELKRDK